MAEVNLAPGQDPSTFDEYPLDFDAFVEGDQFDLGHEAGTDGEDEHTGSAAAALDDQHADFEIGYENEAVDQNQNEDAGFEPAESTAWIEPNTAENDHDEITYDEEELATVDAADQELHGVEHDTEAELPPSADAADEPMQPEDTVLEISHPDETDSRDSLVQADATGELTAGDGRHTTDDEDNLGSTSDEVVDFDTGVERTNVFDSADQVDQDMEIEAGDSKKTVSDAHDSPEIFVTYNQIRYSLFGGPQDDPDSFFLSDTSELDSPLSQFLSCLRDVIAEEWSINDEMRVRIDSLGLEFGEKSQTTFLNHTFREIIDCHTRLMLNDGAEPQPLAFILSVHKDCEDRLAELLAGADAGKGLSELFEHSDTSEGGQDASNGGTGYGEELDTDRFSDEYGVEDEDTAQDGIDGYLGSKEVASLGVIEIDDVDAELLGSAETPGEGGEFIGANHEASNSEDITDEIYHDENYAAYVEEEGGIDIQGSFDEVPTNDQPEESLQPTEITIGQSAEEEQLADGEVLDGTENDLHESILNEDGHDRLEDVLESTAHVDNLEYDDKPEDSGLDLTNEFDVDVRAYSDMQDEYQGATDDLGDGTERDLATDKVTENEVIPASTAPDAASHHTSATSTINGDEINLEPHGEVQPSNIDSNGHEVGGSPKGADEIDWENDEYMPESKLAALTPSSSGKRSRLVDDPESLVDESADNKRRRT